MTRKIDKNGTQIGYLDSIDDNKDDDDNYNRKNKVISVKNELLSSAGWRSWPYPYQEAKNPRVADADKFCLKELHTMLIEVKNKIRTLDYKQARKEALAIIDESKRNTDIANDIDKINLAMKHIGESKYFEANEQANSDARLMLFALFYGSKRERYSREFDRILVTKSFRHMQYKTQVMVNSASDDQRTRLLHSLEVQRIAKTLSTQLGANSNLVQTIAIGHDVGHAPFGHAGERALSRCLTGGYFGDFSHALQSVKVLNYIEKHPIMERYGFRGLGLSAEVLSGILKHDTDTFCKDVSSAAFRLQYECPEIAAYYPDNNGSKHKNLTMGTLEAQIVYWADKIAYIGHDWEEFVLSSYLDKLLPDMNDILGKIGEIMSADQNDLYGGMDYEKRKFECENLGQIQDSVLGLNQSFNNEDWQNNQNHLYISLNSKIGDLLNIRKAMMDSATTVYCKLLSRSEYDKLFDYFEVALAWMRITKRVPKKYKECNDIIYILYRFLKDTISQRSTPRLETVLINRARKQIGNMQPQDIVDISGRNWKTITRLKKRGSLNAEEGADVFESEKKDKRDIKDDFKRALVVSLDDNTFKSLRIIDDFKDRYYVGCKEVQHMTDQAFRIINRLFEYFLEHPEMLPDECLEEYFLLVDGQYDKYNKLVMEYIIGEYLKQKIDQDVIVSRDFHKNLATIRKISKDNMPGTDQVAPEMSEPLSSILKIIGELAKSNEQIRNEIPAAREGRQEVLFEKKFAGKNKRVNPFRNHVSKTILARIIADYICGMTDRMAILKYSEITSSTTSWTENYNER
jgi:predicted deoxyguanosinetriphosphate triphosphohydrolase